MWYNVCIIHNIWWCENGNYIKELDMLVLVSLLCSSVGKQI